MLSLLQGAIGAGEDLDRMLRLAQRRSLAVLRRSSMHFCTMCSPASGHSDAKWPRALRSAWRATGRPTFTATSKFSFITPQVPPWPEQRSITSTGSRGSAAASPPLSGPCSGRAHGRRDARVTPPGERLEARRQPFLLGDVDDVFGDIEGRVGQPLARPRSSGTISGHSNFSISAQDGTERDDVVALVDPASAARSTTFARLAATAARSPCSSCGMPQQRDRRPRSRRRCWPARRGVATPMRGLL